MNILVIGSQGFIGSHLCNFFALRAYTVVGVDVLEVSASFTYEYIKVSRLSSNWGELFQNKQFDFCINAAGSGNVAYSVTHPLIDFEANTLDVIQLLDAIKTHHPTCKYIHLSSAAVYGNPINLPINEKDLLKPISPYGYHKQMSEIICNEYANLFNLKIAIIRPFSIFGNGLRKQLIWDMCRKFISNDQIILFGTGNETRDFIHISDFVQLIEIVLENADFDCTVYNAASGIETKISDVANIFVEYYGYTKSVCFNGVSKIGDPKNWCACIDSVSNIGFKPTANFTSEIISYINWFNKLNAKE